MAEAPRTVKFNRVTNPRVRAPSWLPQPPQPRPRMRKNSESPPLPSLRPPRLPSEFVPPRHGLYGSVSREVMASAPEPLVIVDPQATAAFEEAIELLVHERSRVLEQTASQLGELATIIARRVIAHEISLNPNIVAGLVNEGLAALGAHDRVLVRVGRSFAESCVSLSTRLADRGAHAEVRLDQSLPDYGCIVETELGRVDESIETRISTLLQALKPESAPEGEPR